MVQDGKVDPVPACHFNLMACIGNIERTERCSANFVRIRMYDPPPLVTESDFLLTREDINPASARRLIGRKAFEHHVRAKPDSQLFQLFPGGISRPVVEHMNIAALVDPAFNNLFDNIRLVESRYDSERSLFRRNEFCLKPRLVDGDDRAKKTIAIVIYRKTDE